MNWQKSKILFFTTGAALVVLGATRSGLFAAEEPKLVPIEPAQAEFFETKIRPVLANNCYSCHSDKKQKGGLRVDGKALLLKGGDSGPALVEKDPAKSLLIKAVKHMGDLQMPPGKKLKDEEIADLEAWVKMGSPWPNDAPKAATTTTPDGGYVISEAQRKFWSFQPVRNYAPPKVKNGGWISNPVDAFILAKLEARGLAPAKIADKATLIRRATFDLHGLPPTPDEVQSFVGDATPNAYEKVIDRLLASPRYGERWGRHWLDVARYADTKGYVFQEDRNYPNAFQYRDWVIRAFNEDLPYDQFIIQQLAADRLPDGDPRRLAAMGFLRVGRRFLNQQPDIIDDRIDTAMRGFQGLSVACARCHDHKFDPIPTQDYYSLYGVFASSTEPPDTPISPKTISEPWAAHDKKVRETDAEEDNLIKEQVKLLREREKKGEALPDEIKKTLAKFREREKPDAKELAALLPAFEEAAREKVKTLGESLAALKKSYPPTPERAMTMADAEKPVEQHIFRRGNQGNKGDLAPRRFLAILSGEARPEWKNGSGRLELAQSIASKDNPLTARVMVNRLWMQHFGTGLVGTPSDFGTRGEAPTHQELIDYLSKRFMDSGWSIKAMQKLIMMSSAYRQSNDFNAKSFASDPENTLIWRMNRRRLELEALRDSLLYASGKLDAKVGGPAVDLWQTPYPARRSVYGLIERQNLPGIFKTFDFATPDASSPQRFKTVVPQQALFLMNNDFVVDQAQQLANRPEITTPKDDVARIRALYQILFSRAPDAAEIALGQKYLQAAPGPAPDLAPQFWRYGWGGFDEKSNRVTGFTPLAVFKDGSYRVGAEFPHPQLGYVSLGSGGGHPGHDSAHAAIRRWVAPHDGVVSIQGTANHPADAGDGLELRIVSSRSGSLGTWTIQNSSAETKVEKIALQKGDTLDFVASPRTSDNSDSFGWVVSIVMPKGPSWSSLTQFSAPPGPAPASLSSWARYAQALLMSNEFYFVD